MEGIEPTAGPSHSSSTAYTTIPSHGPEFFQYRRRLFLAGLPLPRNPSSHMPETYTVPLPYPTPLPTPISSSGPSTGSVAKLESLLKEEGAEESMAAWTGGLAGVHARLDGCKRLNRPLKLGLVIKVLKAGWVRDGTWPTDPTTRRAIRPPPSPTPRTTPPQPSRQAPMPPLPMPPSQTSASASQSKSSAASPTPKPPRRTTSLSVERPPPESDAGSKDRDAAGRRTPQEPSTRADSSGGEHG